MLYYHTCQRHKWPDVCGTINSQSINAIKCFEVKLLEGISKLICDLLGILPQILTVFLCHFRQFMKNPFPLINVFFYRTVRLSAQFARSANYFRAILNAFRTACSTFRRTKELQGWNESLFRVGMFVTQGVPRDRVTTETKQK